MKVCKVCNKTMTGHEHDKDIYHIRINDESGFS